MHDTEKHDQAQPAAGSTCMAGSMPRLWQGMGPGRIACPPRSLGVGRQVPGVAGGDGLVVAGGRHVHLAVLLGLWEQWKVTASQSIHSGSITQGCRPGCAQATQRLGSAPTQPCMPGCAAQRRTAGCPPPPAIAHQRPPSWTSCRSQCSPPSAQPAPGSSGSSRTAGWRHPGGTARPSRR